MKIALCSLAVALGLVSVAPVSGQTTAFTYQGFITDGGAPANGVYDLRFNLFPTGTGGSALAGAVAADDLAVTNGLINVTLDFGAMPFDGDMRWLEISVRPGASGGAFATLVPRQLIASTPYAIRAANATAAATVSGAVAASQLTGTIASSNIASGTISSTMLAPGAITTAALADSAVTAAKVLTREDWGSFLKVTNPAPAGTDRFGKAVAAVGSDCFVVGVPYKDAGYGDAGRAYLFSTSGALLTTFTNPAAYSGDNFGGVVAAVGADKVLIGAAAFFTGPGRAFLFSTNGALLTTIYNPTPSTYDAFGWSVAAVGTDRLLVGAYGDDVPGASDAGAAHLFGINGTLLATVTNPFPQIGDSFGIAVAAAGTDKLLIGAPSSFGGIKGGAAYLYDTNGTLLTVFTNPTPASGDEFGFAVAALGADRVLVGAHGDNLGAPDAGVAYLFSTNGTLLTTFTNPTPADSDWFGYTVAAVGVDRVLIGAHQDDTGATDTGAAYLFTTNGTLVATFTNPASATADYFGVSVAAVGGNRVLIGAQNDDTGAPDAGAAYLFSLAASGYTPGMVSDGARSSSITTTMLADGAVTAAKIGGVLNASQIPGLDASKVVTGTIDDTRLSPNVALRAGGNTFTGNQIVTNGLVGVGRVPLANQFEVEGTASKASAGGWLANSDARIKTGVQTLTNALDRLSRVRLVQFQYTDDYRAAHPGLANQSYLNVIAQEFQQVFPEHVTLSGETLSNGGGRILQVDTYPLTIYSAAAIQELSGKFNEELKLRAAENAELKQRLAALEKLVNRLTVAQEGAAR